ncbi:MAG: methyltransferase domain-containing protein [Acidobacteria bacterium]|nr:methyltransferase domain-containing protein [Acidobacteriota bacterium]
MAKRVCPWWLGYLLASPIRRLMCDPAKVLAPYVREGTTVLEPGPGMGFFTLELARRVGPSGRVVAVDLQPRMLAGLKRRAARAGLLERVDARLGAPDSLGVADLAGTVDFVLAFAVVHELPSMDVFFQESAAALKEGGTLLLAEPRGHVSSIEFESELRAAAQSGLNPADRPKMRGNHVALLTKA